MGPLWQAQIQTQLRADDLTLRPHGCDKVHHYQTTSMVSMATDSPGNLKRYQGDLY